MANVFTELRYLPPPTTPLFLKLGGVKIAGENPPEDGTPEAVLWNITAAFHPQASGPALGQALQQFPTGFAVAFAVSSEDLPSAVHATLATAGYFGFTTPQQVSLPDDPPINLLDFVQAAEGVPSQAGTNFRQPTLDPARTPAWFMPVLGSIIGVPKIAAPAPPAEPEEPLVLEAGAMAPLTLKRPSRKKKAAPKKAARGKVAATG